MSTMRALTLMTVAAAAAACSSQHQGSITTGARATTSGGDVALSGGVADGIWIDRAGGWWMDTSGALLRGGRSGQPVGFRTEGVRALSQQNMLAHLLAADSIEVAISRIGVQRARDASVRDFAQRMVNEHSSRMQVGRQTAAQGGVLPVRSPSDTADAMMAMRLVDRLEDVSDGASGARGFDAQYLAVQVMLHQHMLYELNLMRPQASGVLLQLIEQAIPVVQQHLASSRQLEQQVSGGRD